MRSSPARLTSAAATLLAVAVPLAGAADGAPTRTSADEAPCRGGWSTTGAARTRALTREGLRLHIDVPRASPECTEAIEAQVGTEMLRLFRETAARGSSGDTSCHLGHAASNALSWRCNARWREGGPDTQSAAIFGLSARAASRGVAFEPPFVGCSGDARHALVEQAIAALPPRLRPALEVAARDLGGRIGTYREGASLFVTFGPALPHEGPESTVARLPFERYASLCGRRE